MSQKTYLRIWVKDSDFGWMEIPNGPFPITKGDLNNAREMFRKEFDACKPLTGARQSPQSASRALLKGICPYLSDFDVLSLGYAVSNTEVKFQEENFHS